MPRVYVPYVEKHKWPKGYGSLCPAMPPEVPEQLLQRAVTVPDVHPDQLWVACGRWCFRVKRSEHEGPNAWHGFPEIGGEVDERVWTVLQREGLISRGECNRLRRQRELPEAWP